LQIRRYGFGITNPEERDAPFGVAGKLQLVAVVGIACRQGAVGFAFVYRAAYVMGSVYTGQSPADSIVTSDPQSGTLAPGRHYG